MGAGLFGGSSPGGTELLTGRGEVRPSPPCTSVLAAANTTPTPNYTLAAQLLLLAPPLRARIFTLWKAMQLRRRVLLYASPPVGQLCQQVLSVHRVLNGASASSGASSGVPPSDLLLYVGLNDERELASRTAARRGGPRERGATARHTSRRAPRTAPSKPEGSSAFLARRDAFSPSNSSEASASWRARRTRSLLTRLSGHLRRRAQRQVAAARRPGPHSQGRVAPCGRRRCLRSTSEAWRSPPRRDALLCAGEACASACPRARPAPAGGTHALPAPGYRRPLVRPFANSSQASRRRSAALPWAGARLSRR